MGWVKTENAVISTWCSTMSYVIRRIGESGTLEPFKKHS
jgi:hypothetical protein